MDLTGLAALLSVPAILTAAFLPLIFERTHYRQLAKLVDLRAKILGPSPARDDIDWLIADSASELLLRRKAPRGTLLQIGIPVVALLYGLLFLVFGIISIFEPGAGPSWGPFNWQDVLGMFLIPISIVFLRWRIQLRRAWINKEKGQRLDIVRPREDANAADGATSVMLRTEIPT